MSDVFISYARPDEPIAKRVDDALTESGYRVWRDEDLPAHRPYAEVIQERLRGAKAVVVLWSDDAVKSQWVRSEADAARQLETLVQVGIDGTIPPMPFDQIQCADLKDWDGTREGPGWLRLTSSVAALAGPGVQGSDEGTRRHVRKEVSVCVLPFINMSGDPEQEYFSDGISEDITTDLSKISALAITARNTAFTFKAQSVDVCEVARKLGVCHVLEGSVRKAGGRVRITAQLIDGASGDHVWAERYDRDLTDIFAIQDEISKAIVEALKLKLLPAEKEALEQRGTQNVDAYNLYLMARQQWISGVYGDIGKDQSIVRICKQAVALDPNYAQAWALMALAQAELRFWHGTNEDALPAAERALLINPDLAEARCVKARYLEAEGRDDEAMCEVALALQLDPESWEVNREAGRMLFREGRIGEAIPHFEKATELMASDFNSPGQLLCAYRAAGSEADVLRTARLLAERAEAAIALNPSNSGALAKGSGGLVALGQVERAKEWIERAALLDPESPMMLYNCACVLTREIGDYEAALNMFERYFERVKSTVSLKHARVDPDLDEVRDRPEFMRMMGAAEQRLGMKPKAAIHPDSRPNS